ncbi:hypothetical protein LJR074_003375 [Acidovorax sp. LjRoot74]|uniref:WD40/YVTN/BNR-like repeat-containing protein n=1 Tax=Acidovorax sp. LjRoot74 TaxID=3342337 RepID=UPI003ECFB6FD
MSAASQFGGGMPLGSTAKGYGLTEPQWVRADGRALTRAGYPRLSTKFPFGRLTGTIRTLGSTPSSYSVAASPTYFVTPLAAGNPGMQYSTDGATWSSASLSTPSASVACVIWAGARFCAVNTTTTQPFVTTGDNPNSTWTSTSGGINSVPAGLLNLLAYGSTPARIVSIGGSSGTSVYTLDNGATAWTNRTGLTSLNRRGVCWSGQKFFIVCENAAVVSSSTDGITWAESQIPEAIAASSGDIASNGSGVIVMTGAASGLWVSSDHGVTWCAVGIPGVASSTAWKVTYSGDRFFIPTAAGVAMSMDGKEWFVESQSLQARALNSGFAKKGSAIVQIQASATAYSFTESATDFCVPMLQSYSPAVSGNPIASEPVFIKAL